MQGEKKRGGAHWWTSIFLVLYFLPTKCFSVKYKENIVHIYLHKHRTGNSQFMIRYIQYSAIKYPGISAYKGISWAFYSVKTKRLSGGGAQRSKPLHMLRAKVHKPSTPLNLLSQHGFSHSPTLLLFLYPWMATLVLSVKMQWQNMNAKSVLKRQLT